MTNSIASLSSVNPQSLDDAALLAHVREVEELGRVVDALRVTAAAEVATRSRHELGSDGLARRMGYSRASHLLETLTGSSARDVGARLSLGALVAPRTSAAGVPLPALYPAVAASLAAGQIGYESARAIARTLEQAYSCDPVALAYAERVLVDEAQKHSADLVAAQARIWREALDPDGAEPRHEVLHARRSLRFGREVNGMARLTVDATGADLAELRATFSAYASPRVMPRFRSADDVDPADPMRETRSREQRDFDVLMGLVRAGARSDSTRPGPRASIAVTVRERDLRDGRGVAWLDGADEPVPASVFNELHCAGDRRSVVVSATGEVLALGRRERLFSDAQHAALAVRDGGCIWPHCTAPPSWCDAHHVEHWQNGGPTDVANGALLCPAHHRLLHSSDFTLRMRDGVPYLRAPARLDPTGAWRRVGGSRVLTAVARM